MRIETENIIKVVKSQTKGMYNLQFHKYWLDNFIVRNKETGSEIFEYFKAKDLDELFTKIKNKEWD